MAERDLIPIHGIYENAEVKALFYKKIFDDFPALIWLSGTDAKCWYFNKKWLSFRGRSLTEEFGDGWTKGVHPEDYDRCIDVYMSHFQIQEPFSMEYRLQNAHGEYRWILDMGIPFYGVDQAFEGYIGSCYDITEEKENLMALEKSKTAALEAYHARTELISYVSHEIRNPLSAIIGIVDLLSANTYDPETNDLISHMKSSSSMLLDIINNLLDLSRFESKAFVCVKEPVDIQHVFNEMDKIYRSRIEKNGLIFDAHLDSCFPRRIFTDEMKIKQILSNLIGNAIKFTTEGRITLHLAYEHPTQQLLMVVEDTGCGINQEKQRHMFEEYVQGDTAIFKKYGGTGLGLSIVKTLTSLMDGTIEVDTRLGHGTRFVIRIPVSP